MILYGYSNRFSKQECDEIYRYARSRKLKIVCIGGIQRCCDVFLNINAFEVLAYFRNAECVVTDTFHGTIFSVISHRRFVSIVRAEGYENSQKLRDLLARLDLKERIATSVSSIDDVLEKPIDFTPVDSIIENERRKSYDYMEKWIK